MIVLVNSGCRLARTRGRHITDGVSMGWVAGAHHQKNVESHYNRGSFSRISAAIDNSARCQPQMAVTHSATTNFAFFASIVFQPADWNCFLLVHNYGKLLCQTIYHYKSFALPNFLYLFSTSIVAYCNQRPMCLPTTLGMHLFAVTNVYLHLKAIVRTWLLARISSQSMHGLPCACDIEARVRAYKLGTRLGGIYQ